MSTLFFDELKMKSPDINLKVKSNSHGAQTAKIIKRYERVLMDTSPNLVIVFGDVNSTIACALAAVKLHISVAHVEAGLRSFDRSMPEEINRILTDQISRLLFITSPEAKTNLNKCETKYDNRSKELFDIIIKPQVLDESIGTSLKKFKSNLEKLKIPANVTRQFFEEIKEEEKCICDNKIGEKEINAIDQNKNKYLDEETAGIYNAIKTDIFK